MRTKNTQFVDEKIVEIDVSLEKGIEPNCYPGESGNGEPVASACSSQDYFVVLEARCL
jgi:hypothetical protein